MKNKDAYRGKKVTVIGMARSGIAAAKLLHSIGAHVCISDGKDTPEARAALAEFPSDDIAVELGFHSRSFIEQADLLVVSPGVHREAQPVKWAEAVNVPVISEIELAWSLCPATVIAVTGSNGKTTVTTLIGRMLEAAGKKAVICGNIGKPFSGELAEMTSRDFVSLEVSSFQLERIKHFKPKIAVVLNMTPNHLDRHKDMEEYIQAKKRVMMNQDAHDFLVLNADDPVLRTFGKEARAHVTYFSRTAEFNPNHAAVFAVGKLLGITDETIQGVFARFKGIEHRMEEVAVIGGVRFINDSKATTVDSARWALESIGSPVVLIAGGKHKGVDYRCILDTARVKVKKAVLIGEAKELIHEALCAEISCEFARDLKEAVQKAFAAAQAGDCVLLSPMCASFDMFADYEDRGQKFKEIVLSVAGAEPAHAKASKRHKKE